MIILSDNMEVIYGRRYVYSLERVSVYSLERVSVYYGKIL